MNRHINLETYFQALFQIEPIPSQQFSKKQNQAQHKKILDIMQREDVLGQLSTIEITGKDHIEEYLHYPYCCHFQANTIMNSYK